jgi:hypothetical protein
MMRRFFTVTAFTLLVCSARLASAEEMQPGQYASTNVVELVNGKKNTFQARECITAKDIADGLTKVGIESDGGCKVQDLVKGNGKITYRLICEEDGKKQLAEVVGTYTASSYEFAIKAAAPGAGYRSISVTGKRLGPCM